MSSAGVTKAKHDATFDSTTDDNVDITRMLRMTSDFTIAEARREHPAVGGQRRRQLRQRARRDGDRALQDGGHPPPRPLTQPGGAGVDTLEWIDWFNNRRLLEPLGHIPPAEAEAKFFDLDGLAAMTA